MKMDPHRELLNNLSGTDEALSPHMGKIRMVCANPNDTNKEDAEIVF